MMVTTHIGVIMSTTVLRNQRCNLKPLAPNAESVTGPHFPCLIYNDVFLSGTGVVGALMATVTFAP